MLVAQRPHALHVAVRRHQHAVGAGDGLEDERRNRVRPLELDHFLEILQRRRRVVPAARHAVIRVEHVHDAGHRRLAPAARIAGGGNRRRGAAVVRAVARQDLLAAGHGARDLERVLVGLGAAVGEEEGVDVAGRDLGQLRAEPRAHLGRHRRRDVGDLLRLLGDGGNHARIAVADVHRHQLAVEVDEALALGRPEVDALRLRDRNRIDGVLRRVLGDGVLLRERDDLIAGHGSPVIACSVFRNEPAPARPVNVPPSTITLPREITVSVHAGHLAPLVRVVVHLHVQRLRRQPHRAVRDRTRRCRRPSPARSCPCAGTGRRSSPATSR